MGNCPESVTVKKLENHLIFVRDMDNYIPGRFSRHSVVDWH